MYFIYINISDASRNFVFSCEYIKHIKPIEQLKWKWKISETFPVLNSIRQVDFKCINKTQLLSSKA